jgi:hypothetical protein
MARRQPLAGAPVTMRRRVQAARAAASSANAKSFFTIIGTYCITFNKVYGGDWYSSDCCGLATPRNYSMGATNIHLLSGGPRGPG